MTDHARDALRADPAKVSAWRQRSRKRLPARSAKRIADDEIWAEVRATAFRRDNFTCQAPRPWHAYSAPGIEPCWGDLDPHHIWPTGDGGPRLVLDNVVTLCRGHHDWAHGMGVAASCVTCMEDGPVAAPTRPERATVTHTFTARFAGHCPACDLPIAEGVTIHALSTGVYVHQGCE